MASGYWRPRSVNEAVSLKEKHAKSLFLAGGTEIGRLGAAKTSRELIDLRDAGLGSISQDPNGRLSLGSMVTFTQALESELVPEALKEALRFMGSMPKRNMATIGGNVMRHGSDSYLLPTLAAYDAILFFAGSGNVGIDEFLSDPSNWESELLEKVLIDPSRKVFSKRFSNTKESHAALTLAVGEGKGYISLAAAVRPSGVQTLSETRMLMGRDVDRKLFHETLMGEMVAEDDVTGSAEYKRYVAEEILWSWRESLRKEHV